MLTSVFGISVEYTEWDKKKSLPLYIASSYSFSCADIEGVRCIVISPNFELTTLPALKKHIERIQELDTVPVVLKLDSVSFYRRKSLIENHIPFFTDKQVYLPFIRTLLTNEEKTKKKIARFVFSTQQLFLLYLYNDNPKLYVSEATKMLPFTAMTMSRAVRELEASGLFNVTKDGVNKIIEAKYKRDELFEKAKAFLNTPVKNAGYIDKSRINEDMVLAGESVLSEKTILNPSALKTYAVYEKLFDKNSLTDELINPETQARLELWAYNPKHFSKDEFADSLSVALSLKDSNDERIEEAVEELVKGALETNG